MSNPTENYESWYEQANMVVLRIAGVGIDDLGDGLSRDAYLDGISAEEYAVQRLEEEGFPF